MNKKIVFLIVSLECILAVVIVSVFGHAIEASRTEILCKEIYFTYSEGEKKGQKIEDGVMITVDTDTLDYQLTWVMETDKTSNKEVLFTSSKPDVVKVNPATGLVTFTEKTDVKITVQAKDGSGAMDSITLIPKRGGGIVE